VAVRKLYERNGEIITPIKAERFTKRMTEVWRHVVRKEVFTPTEERILSVLADYLQLNTNAIVTPGGEYMNIDEMARQTGMDRSNMRKWVKSLIRKNAIGKWVSGETEAYFINPYLYQCGDVKPFLFLLFDREAAERMEKESVWQRFKAGRKKTSIIYLATAKGCAEA